MVVLKCSKNGLVAVICDDILRVYNVDDATLIHKSVLRDQAETSNEETQFLSTTYSYGCAFSSSGDYLASFSHNKDLIVWETSRTEEDWKQIGKRKLVKRPTAILITNSEKYVVISDKSGDIYSYLILEDLPNETLLLGHVSIILDMAISENDQYLITADRDEKIRVSCFPNSYNIESFCLGHKEFVMKIMILTTLPTILVSASGDGSVHFWDFKLGSIIHVVSFQDKYPNNQSVPVISCLACSKYDNIVFIGIKGSLLLHVYQITKENKVKYLLDIQLDGSPCCLAVDHNNRLWVVQSSDNQTIIVFDINCEGDQYKFNRISSCPSISKLFSAEGWNLIFAGLKEIPCFESLSKKEGYGTSEYYNRKKERIEGKIKKTNRDVKRNADDTIYLNNVKKCKT